MTRWLHENSDKPHRCPACHCVMLWRYKPIRKFLFGDMEGVSQVLFRGPRWLPRAWGRLDRWMPRRCQKCGDVIAVPAWAATIFRLPESY